MDESAADDGAIHRFYAWLVARRQAGARIDLEDIDELRAAVDVFNREETA
jgi:hypothetical protein